MYGLEAMTFEDVRNAVVSEGKIHAKEFGVGFTLLIIFDAFIRSTSVGEGGTVEVYPRVCKLVGKLFLYR